jgi:hypothetical protein
MDTMSSFSDGSDIALTTSPPPTVDVSSAKLATVACPVGRSPGP